MSSRPFRKQRPVRRGIDDDSLELLAENAALLVLLVDQKEIVSFSVVSLMPWCRRGMQDADLDGVVSGFGGAERGQAKTRRGRLSNPRRLRAAIS